MRVGVLALQGDVREHVRALEVSGATAVPVRRPAELDAVDGLVIPGGESTTISKLAAAFELTEPLRKRIADGLPAYGSCAGMILLADRIVDGIAGQETLGGLDVTVRRNAFGRQVDSFEEDIEILGQPFHAVFIRAPWVESVGPGVEVLGRTCGAGQGGTVEGGAAGGVRPPVGSWRCVRAGCWPRRSIRSWRATRACTRCSCRW